MWSKKDQLKQVVPTLVASPLKISKTNLENVCPTWSGANLGTKRKFKQHNYLHISNLKLSIQF